MALENTLELDISESVCDRTGRRILTYRPVFWPNVCARGSLSFSTWQVWADEPETHAVAQRAAMDNARTVLRNIANDCSRSP